MHTLCMGLSIYIVCLKRLHNLYTAKRINTRCKYKTIFPYLQVLSMQNMATASK